MPLIYNLRQDPFERTPTLRGESLNDSGGGYMNDFFAREFWRFVMVQQYVTELAKTAILVPSEDIDAWAEAILRVARDDELRRRLADHAYTVFIREYTWQARAARVLEGI